MCTHNCKSCKEAPDKVIVGEGFVIYDDFSNSNSLSLSSDSDGMDLISLVVPFSVTEGSTKYRLILEKVNED